MNTYEIEKNKAYRYYKKLDKVYCPYLKTEVVFNSNGFRHLIYKNRNVKRDEKTILFRLKLLSKAPKLISLTNTIQEYSTYQSIVEVKRHTKRLHKRMDIEYSGFIAIIDGWKVKVIIKKIGNGNYYFWSIIPNWITSRRRDKGMKYINFTGDLEND